MQKHILLTLGGVVVGMLALAWVQPEKTGGAMLLIVMGMLLFNALGIAASAINQAFRGRPAPSIKPSDRSQSPVTRRVRSKVKTRLIPLTLLLQLCIGAAMACETDESCNRCLISAFGRCVQYGNDPICEARKALCQSAPAIINTPNFRILFPARVFLPAEDIPPTGLGAYGVFSLRAKPTPASLPRLRMACASYLATLPAQSTLPSNIPLQDQMLTIWPLETAGKPEAKLDDCDHLLNNYDLHGGISAIQDADRQGNSLTGRGPYLIGWSPSNTRGVRDAVVLVLDMSSIESQQSFDEMFLIWQKRIVENPELWRSGFSAEKLRLAIRDFVDRYGQSILDSVKLVRSGG